MNIPTTDAQFMRLPLHARESISKLQTELERANRRIDEMRDELTPRDTLTGRVSYQDSLLMMDDRRPMPDGSYFHFRLNAGDVRVTMQYNNVEDFFYLDVSADQTLIVAPGATNCVKLFDRRRFLA